MSSQFHFDTAPHLNVLEIIEHTHRSLFLTGKAGTGKSTFLRHICKTTKKKHVVLAPTGIAAINAGGMTLHSFFKLPFHPLLPNDVSFSPRRIRQTLKYDGEKIKLIRQLELIIIDEISMVRADIIDFIDKLLRIYSGRMRQPFGGKQLLLIGDIFQLEPVIREEDRQLLRPFYQSMYFFNARVFHEMQLVSVELTKVYRQRDAKFVGLLDSVRSGRVSQQQLDQLNSRAGTTLSNHSSQLSITLSTRRDTVDYINDRQLKQLPGHPATFMGTIHGEFPVNSLPTPQQLDIKDGAQVIFIKNDPDHRWVNGTLGIVESIDYDNTQISVITEQGNQYTVQPAAWSNMRYTFNEEEQKIEEQEIGLYEQFPLRLAWAITVHKSQGLTFNQVNIDFTGGAFAAGQTYVALSRCRSLEGLSLKEPLRQRDIIVRPEVMQFARHYNDATIMRNAMNTCQADIDYRDALSAFDAGDFDSFLTSFFKAIHGRYIIEHPMIKRYLRRKLGVITQLRQEITHLKEEMTQQEALLKKLSVEYVMMGKECEREQMPEAALANYRKALSLYPHFEEPKRRIAKIEKKMKKS